jgi:methionine-R-sulfoxide reductase
MTNRRTLLKLMGLTGCSLLFAGCDESPVKQAQKEDSPMPASTQPVATTVSVKVFNAKGQLVGPVTMPKVIKSDAEWQKQLTPEQYEIARDKGTERPFCGTLLDNHKVGIYTCICCGLPLFSSDSKFNSGTGWPSFFAPVAEENVTEHQDSSYGMVRTEILCTRCDCHLGHVFDDGPRPTGLRFCVNSESLSFTLSTDLAKLADPAAPA